MNDARCRTHTSIGATPRLDRLLRRDDGPSRDREPDDAASRVFGGHTEHQAPVLGEPSAREQPRAVCHVRYDRLMFRMALAPGNVGLLDFQVTAGPQAEGRLSVDDGDEVRVIRPDVGTANAPMRIAPAEA